MNRTRGKHLINKLNEILTARMDNSEKIQLYYKILQYVFDEFADRVNIQLTSLFSKMAFIGNQFGVNRQLMFHLHAFRNKVEMGESIEDENWEDWNLKMSLGLRILIAELLKMPIDIQEKERFFKKFAKKGIYRENQTIRQAEFLLKSIDPEKCEVRGQSPATDAKEIILKFNDAGWSEIFWSQILELKELDLLPMTLNLHRIAMQTERIWVPEVIVIEPSYLVDVTAIAECFTHRGAEPRLSLVKSFIAPGFSKYLLLGHIANFLLDRIIADPEIDFDSVTKSLFQLAPLQFSLYSDELVKEILTSARIHFNNLKEVVRKEFALNGLSRSNIFIEPSFLSPEYGIQGRLDLFHLDPRSKKAAIVELKSGKPYRPNHYKLSNNHYVQTLLYDLMIQSVFGHTYRRNNFILYSAEESQNLRFAPTLVSQQVEAVKARNDILLAQYRLEKMDTGNMNALDSLRSKDLKSLSGYHKRDLDYFNKTIASLDDLSRAYFHAFAAFIATERRLSKTGVSDSERNGGLSSIWTHSIESKVENFDILNHLEIIEIRSADLVPVLVFKKSSQTATLSNFRQGDIGVIYPELETEPSVLHTQIFKCTIISMERDFITVRLRSQQMHSEIFRQPALWHLEHDHLDSGYIQMYRSLFEFAVAPDETRSLLLGNRPPQEINLKNVPSPQGLSTEQIQLFREAVSSEEYYLLWGPPGTGKTSVMIRSMIEHLIYKEREHLLVLAYTNRAVDEICESIVSISEDLGEQFIRIGSRYACKEKFQSNLLGTRLELLSHRDQVQQLIQKSQLFVGTISSVLGKSELFDLKKFDRIIVDEASQILEPNLIGLLSRARRFILIGDHRQLPAIVRQQDKNSQVHDSGLHQIGLNSRSDSLFERLFGQCQRKGWDWAYGQLHSQGRMHIDIMNFVNREFYQGSLAVFPSMSRLTSKLSMASESELGRILAEHRLLFFPTGVEKGKTIRKTNIFEAKLVLEIIQVLKRNWELSGKEWKEDTLGIITPFRAQISLVKTLFSEASFNSENISVDTVERYQGSARDIIVILFCMNHPSQMNSLVSLSTDGIDRKLNVALSRAREQLILIGNERILSSNAVYKRLLGSCQKPDFIPEKILK